MYANYTVVFELDGPRLVSYITNQETKEIRKIYDEEADAILSVLKGEYEYKKATVEGFVKE